MGNEKEINYLLCVRLKLIWCPCEFSVNYQICKEAMISMFNSSKYEFFFFFVIMILNMLLCHQYNSSTII